MRPDTHDLSFLIDHLIQEEGVGDRKQGPEGGGQIPGGKGTGEKAEYCIAAVPYFRPFFQWISRFCTFSVTKIPRDESAILFSSIVQIHAPFLCFRYVLANSLKTSKQIMSSQCHQ